MLKALGDGTRLRIFTLLISRKHCVRSVSRTLGITESAVSQHLKVLREAGLVYSEKHGHHSHYSPRQEALDFLAEETERIRQSAMSNDGDSSLCRCEYRKENENAC